MSIVLGLQLTGKPALIAGVEARQCVAAGAEALARLEVGGDPARLLVGGRWSPFDEEPYYGEPDATVGFEGALGVDIGGNGVGQLAVTYGVRRVHGALQLRSRLSVPDEAARAIIVIGIAPWTDEKYVGVPGRPVSRAGRILRPDILCRAAANDAEGQAVAAHFTSSAQFEYSSVWTFLRLAHELAALGAPTRLIVAALDAADDEVRHAEMCGQLAGGVQLATLPDDVARARFTTRSNQAIALLAAEAWLEGCLNEGAAAEEARIAATEAEGAARQALATIAIDERSHAELSWGVLAFLRDLAPEVVAQALADIPRPASPSGRAIDPALARHGVPTAEVTQDAWSSAERLATERLAELV